MNQEVALAVEELKRAFAPSEVAVVDDQSGGAYVFVETVGLGPAFEPSSTWIGGHITALYPAADIYPVFIGAEVRLANGGLFQAPVTHGHQFAGRPAIQVSRRNNQIHLAPQTAVAKFNKVLDFLEKMP